MAQIRLESTVRHHPKFLRAGGAACWLYTCAIGHCQDHLTDGFISKACLTQLGPISGPGWTSLERLAGKLVEVGLWDEVEDGWIIHDYLDCNKSRKAVLGIKEKKKHAGSEGGRRSWETRAAAGMPVGQPKHSASHDTKQSASEFDFPSLKQSASNYEADSKQSATSNTNPDHDHDHEKIKAAAAPPSAPTNGGKPVENPNDNVGVITALVKKELLPLGIPNDDLIEATKTRCAQQGIAYNSMVVRKAVDSALAQISRSH